MARYVYALLPRVPAASIEGARLQCCTAARLKRRAIVARPLGRVFRMFWAVFARALLGCIGGPCRAPAMGIVIVFKPSAAVERPRVPGAPPKKNANTARDCRANASSPPETPRKTNKLVDAPAGHVGTLINLSECLTESHAPWPAAAHRAAEFCVPYARWFLNRFFAPL